jgi:hypothetical protein
LTVSGDGLLPRVLLSVLQNISGNNAAAARWPSRSKLTNYNKYDRNESPLFSVLPLYNLNFFLGFKAQKTRENRALFVLHINIALIVETRKMFPVYFFSFVQIFCNQDV